MVTKLKATSHEWYRAYCSAMLETDINKILESVESARKAIQERARELSQTLSGSNHESTELDRASRFLTMLVNCSQAERATNLVMASIDARRPVQRAFATAAR
jgi:hypothetical protein